MSNTDPTLKMEILKPLPFMRCQKCGKMWLLPKSPSSWSTFKERLKRWIRFAYLCITTKWLTLYVKQWETQLLQSTAGQRTKTDKPRSTAFNPILGAPYSLAPSEPRVLESLSQLAA